MADKTYNPPAATGAAAICPRCGGGVVPHGVGSATPTGTVWRYACEGARRGAGRRTCNFTVSLDVPPRPAARPGLAEELRALGREHEQAKPALRLVAKMIEEGAVPEALAAALPPGEATDDLRADLRELGGHACAAGLKTELLLLWALAARGFAPATEAVVKGFRG